MSTKEIEIGRRGRLSRERKAFMLWWSNYDDRDAASLKAAWNAWKRRAGL